MPGDPGFQYSRYISYLVGQDPGIKVKDGIIFSPRGTRCGPATLKVSEDDPDVIMQTFTARQHNANDVLKTPATQQEDIMVIPSSESSDVSIDVSFPYTSLSLILTFFIQLASEMIESMGYKRVGKLVRKSLDAA